jgi:tetraacyldisaccharide 4'-kinase
MTARWQAALVRQWARPQPGLVGRALQPLSWLYGALAAAHAAAYRAGLKRVHRLPVPVVVVGNLVAGGAGKTPVVLHLLRLLRQQGWTPGVVARGHGGSATQATLVSRDTPAALVGDEPLLLHLRTQAPVAVAARRVEAAQLLLRQHPAVDILVSDDGLQHHALARDVQVIVIDARGAGNGLLLPAGPLRQPLPRSVPANSLVLYSGGLASTHLPGLRASRQLGGAVPLADWWQGQAATLAALQALRGAPLLAAAGLAQPRAFFDMLRAQGLSLTELPLPDHHPYTTLPWPEGIASVIVTEKDAVKLRPERVGRTAVWVATLDCQPEPGFDAALLRLLPPRRTPTTSPSSPS